MKRGQQSRKVTLAFAFALRYDSTGGGGTLEQNKQANAERIGKDVRFERIRRITGYLVGTTDRWNDAKKAELRDRVRHTDRKN